MNFLYQNTHEFFAQVTGGMETIGAEELKELGAKNITPVYRGLKFSADMPVLYKINYQSRIISRVLAPLKKFYADNEKSLYNGVKSIKWENIITPEHTFAVFANTTRSKLKHSKYTALLVKDAIADRFREKYGNRPSVDTNNPDIWISLYLDKNKAEISLDTSGGTLAKRGYRKKSVEAPMPETLAAAIIRLSGWDGQHPLYDPMCGSGTILAEALMHYARIPAAYLREKFGFFRLPDFNKQDWLKIKNKADSNIRELPDRLISGSDISSAAVSSTIENLGYLPGAEDIIVSRKDFRNVKNLHSYCIITNPPYGVRMDEENLADLYKELGDFMKQKCTGSTAYIYTANLEMVKKIGLRTSKKYILKNSNLEGRLLKYDLY